MNRVTQFSGNSANLMLYWILKSYYSRFDRIMWIDTLGTFNPAALPLPCLEKTMLVRSFDAQGLKDAVDELESNLKSSEDQAYALCIDSFSNPIGLLMAQGNISFAHAFMMTLGRKCRILTRKFRLAVYLSTSLVYIKQLHLSKPALGNSWPFCLDHSYILEDQQHNKCLVHCNQSRKDLLGCSQLFLLLKGSFTHEYLTIDFYNGTPVSVSSKLHVSPSLYHSSTLNSPS